MSKIALISCTSKKKSYQCQAREMYTESPRFRLAYEYAQLIADKIFILSAKHGVLTETDEIEPYNEDLNDKSSVERKRWGDQVVKKLREFTDLQNDRFIFLAPEAYREHLMLHVQQYWLPLDGKRQGEWIPELKRLIQVEMETDKTVVLHLIFNEMPRLDWTMLKGIPFTNGIYIMFEKGQNFCQLDRIVRVGTHTEEGRLIQRLHNHFVYEHKDSSIFRKNIGRAILTKEDNPFLATWEIDMSNQDNKVNHVHLTTELKATEKRVSQYLRENVSIVCFPVESKVERLRLEEGILSTLNTHPEFQPNGEWLGLQSPDIIIKESGLWNRLGLNKDVLTADELEKIKWNSWFAAVSGNTPRKPKQVKPVDVKPRKELRTQSKAEDVRVYIEKLKNNAKQQGREYIELVSGEIHRELGLKNSMPTVCSAMYKMMQPGDMVLHTTPSGYSSTIKVKYLLC